MNVSWLAEKIEPWPIEGLVPYARNARTHSPEQVAQIAASIAEFGFVPPCLVGSDGVLVAGHGRWPQRGSWDCPQCPSWCSIT